MAKNPFLLYGAKGKVGNLVAQKTRKGDTMVREYVIPSNPKTIAQQAQRLVFSTVATAAAVLKPIINHSFQGKTYGTDSVDYFRKINLKALRALAAQDVAEATSAVDSRVFMSAKGLSALIPNPYIVSEGSLANPHISVARSTQGGSSEGTLNTVTPTGSLQLRKKDTGEYYTTVADVMKAVFGISEVGEEIALMVIAKVQSGFRYTFGDNGSDIAGWAIPYAGASTMRYVIGSGVNAEIILTEANSTTLLESASEQLNNAADAAASAADTDPNLLAIMEETLLVAFNNPGISVSGSTATIAYQSSTQSIDHFTETPEGNGHVYAATIIRSKKSDNVWQRNNATLITAIPVGGVKNFGLDWNTAVQALYTEDQPITTGTGRFLNTGGEPDVIGESFN